MIYPDVSADWNVVGVFDFNGDGICDVLWRRDDGTVTNWLATATGNFISNDANAWQTGIGIDWHVAGTGDFNGDGYGDVLWRRDDGAFTEWLGNANGGFTSNDANAWHSDIGVNWRVVGTGDFNGDGYGDVLWRRDDGAFTDWLGRANGGFISNDANAWHIDIGTDWRVVGTGDFNGGTESDVLWRRDDGALTDWLGLVSGGFVSNDSNAWHGEIGLTWQIIGSGDFNGDGRDDIMWRRGDGAITDWLGQANGGFAGNDANAWRTDIPISWEPTGIGDFNGDGRDDVLWRTADGGLETWRGATDGALLSPAQQLWEDALATVSEFFDAITNQVSGYSSGGSDQDSYYDDGSDHAPFEPVFMRTWGFLSSVQSDPAAHYWDFLTQDVDPEFLLMSLTGAGFNAAFGGNIGSMTQVADLGDTSLFNMNGVLMRGVWHPFETNQDPIPENAVVITGNNVGYWTFEQIGFCGFDPSAGYSPPNNGGGNPAPVPNATPCVETNFATPGVSIVDANRAALDASNEIAALDDETYEYSSIVYSINGVVGHTDPYTNHLADRVNWVGGLSGVPNGAVILGIVHNHPDISGITDTIPSGAGSEDGNDWIMYRTIVNWNNNNNDAHDFPRGITVDPNMLLWIYSNEDHATHVYDNTDKNQIVPSCSLQPH